MLCHIKNRHGDVEGIRDQHDGHKGLEDPFEENPGLKICQVVMIDDQLDQLVAGNKRQDHPGDRHDDRFRDVPDHGEDAGRKGGRRPPYLGCNIPNLLVDRIKHPREVVHDAIDEHSLEPISNLLKDCIQGQLPPLAEESGKQRYQGGTDQSDAAAGH